VEGRRRRALTEKTLRPMALAAVSLRARPPRRLSTHRLAHPAGRFVGWGWYGGGGTVALWWVGLGRELLGMGNGQGLFGFFFPFFSLSCPGGMAWRI
jgi:hypothetical protein